MEPIMQCSCNQSTHAKKRQCTNGAPWNWNKLRDSPQKSSPARPSVHNSTCEFCSFTHHICKHLPEGNWWMISWRERGAPQTEPRNGERNSCRLLPPVSLDNPSSGRCRFCLRRSSLVAALSRPADGKRHKIGTKEALPTAFVLVETFSTKENIPMPSLPFEPLFLLCDRQHASLRVASFHSNQTHSNPLPSVSLPLLSLCAPNATSLLYRRTPLNQYHPSRLQPGGI